jgi:poly(A) polymerase/tRNA nucleotidyltransferase (CCA-adding enzyme)
VDSLQAARNYPWTLKLAVLLHDIGKPATACADKGKGITFHNHEVVGATIAYNLLKRLEFQQETIKYVVKMVRHHMFHFDSKAKDRAIKKWLFKVGAAWWRDLFQLRIADRRGNKSKKDRPAVTREMRKLEQRVLKLISSDQVIFKTDLALPENEIKALSRKDVNTDEACANLIGLVNSDLSRNSTEWLETYVRRIYGWHSCPST